jgi:predicted metalloprotease with PDZ domain
MRFLSKSPFGATVCALLLGASALAQSNPVRLDVDATDAPRKIMHARLRIPVSPGKVMLAYPKWIPGEHMPSGPITDLAGLKFTADGKTLKWERDAEEMYAFHLEVPAGVKEVEVALDYLFSPSSGAFSDGASATSQLVDLNWNQFLLYPKGMKSADVQFTATLKLPSGWKFATALPVSSKSSSKVEFATVSLETLVDSPVIAGAHLRTIDLTPGEKPPHTLNLVADSEAALDITPEDSAHFAHLVTETGALFGARHYRSYHFLLTLSDHVASFGLEHHESSDDREGENYLTDADALKMSAYLLPHEMVHSWNGKYRRPAGLATGDFEKPMKGELLWVYEGLTDYLGGILAARSGLWTNEDYHEYLAGDAALLDRQTGRTWRPLADTTVAAQLLYLARADGQAWRRSTDFYPEGDLIWLEADVIIRQATAGKRSLDDFCKKFHGGESGAPKVVPYTFEDILRTLGEVAPHDWRQVFQTRVYATTPHAPLGGIEGSGWKLVYTDTIPDMQKSRESTRKFTDMNFSLGFAVKEDGELIDVIPGSPAEKAGIGPSMKLVAVNSRHWTPEILRTAVKAAKTDRAAIELLVENEDYYKTYKLDYHDGEKYPHLERDEAKPDLLTEILKPLTPEPAPVVEGKKKK